MKNVTLSMLILLSGALMAQNGEWHSSSTSFMATVNQHLKVREGHGLFFDGNGQSFLELLTDANNAYIDYSDNLFFRMKSNLNNSPLVLYGNGVVGIGMQTSYTPNDYHDLSSEGHKLYVNGSILCEQLKVIQDVPMSDFVFEEDYDLWPLSKVEHYVRENKHLPDVPSAEEFKRDGYNIGEMDDLLLRKVEELTLYVIALKKEVDGLKSENARLRSSESK